MLVLKSSGYPALWLYQVTSRPMVWFQEAVWAVSVVAE